MPNTTGALEHPAPRPTSPLPSAAVSAPIDRLAAAFARWVSSPQRADVTFEGVRLLQVLRILARPVYRLSELNDEADRLARLARCSVWSNGESWQVRQRAARDAERAVNAAYSEILRDVDTLFAALTGVPADTMEALNLRVSARQLAGDARTLLAVAA